MFKASVLFTCVLLMNVFVSANSSSRPPLREEVLLNGTWEQGGMVPIYEGRKFDQQIYQRQVSIPASWTGKVIKVEFGAVNFIADIYVNDQHVLNHVGAWVAFSVDVTNFVKPGSSFVLKVAVKGRLHEPIIDANGKPLWPFGDSQNPAKNDYGGIVDDVYLRAYGKVHIEDAFIQTSYRQKTLTINYTLKNSDTQSHTVRIETIASHAKTGKTGNAVTGPAVALNAGEVKTIRVVSNWKQPELWWPDKPNLYHLKNRIVENKNTLDQETRRFGFREVWINGNQFQLNGVRLNLTGDYVIYGKASHWPAETFTPAGWPKMIDTLKSLNIRILRWHKHPAPQYTLDVADEKGFCLMSESALNGAVNGYLKGYDKPAYLKNSKTWIEKWVKGNRNHPSVLIWSAVNEMYSLTPAETMSMGEAIRLHDNTRPILYEDHKDIGDSTVSYHYPRDNKNTKWNDEPSGNSIYSWAKYVHPTKPTSTGEYAYVPATAKPNAAQERNKWWQGR